MMLLPAGVGLPLVVGGGAPAFTPASISGLLFWFDPNDLTTLFQDVAGTTPVTASGQSVARINNKGSLGGYVAQSNASRRPVYSTAKGRGTLLGDGGDVLESPAAVDLTAYKVASTATAFDVSSTTLGVIFQNGPYYFANNMVSQEAGPGSVGHDQSFCSGDTGYNAGLYAYNTSSTLPRTSIVVATHDVINSLSTTRRNSVAGTSAIAHKGGYANGLGNHNVLLLARDNSGGNGHSDHFYSFVMHDHIYTGPEIAALETYYATMLGGMPA